MSRPPFNVKSDKFFYASLLSLSLVFVLLLALVLLALLFSTTPSALLQSMQSEELLYATKLSLISSTITAILSLWVAVPLGYLMSRFQFKGKTLLDAFLDIPIVLPPLVVGLGLLLMFNFKFGPIEGMPGEYWSLEKWLQLKLGISVTFSIPAVILAQFMVASAFAIRTMRTTFDDISPRTEEVALTLGCNRSQAFWRVVLPQSIRGMTAAATLAWSRSLGEFGPILIFASATRMRTEVLPTSIWLEFSVGDSEAAVAVSLTMVALALLVLWVMKTVGQKASGV